MRTPRSLTLAAIAVLYLLTASALPALSETKAKPGTQVYVNARFGYELAYPVLLTALGEADNGDGQRFVSSDGLATLLVWGSHNVFGDSVRALYERERQAPDRTVTYSLIRDGFFVLSGFAGEDIFYTKTMHNPRADTFATFFLTYPASSKKQFDPIVTMVSTSFSFQTEKP